MMPEWNPKSTLENQLSPPLQFQEDPVFLREAVFSHCSFASCKTSAVQSAKDLGDINYLDSKSQEDVERDMM